MPTRKAIAAIPKKLPIKKKKKAKPKLITSEGRQREIDVMKAAGFSQRRIQEELEKSIFERAEKKKRREAAQKFAAAP